MLPALHGEALSWLSVCLVLCDKDRPHEATRHAKGLDGLAADREGGDRLQKPDMGVQGAITLVFYTDAKAEDGRAWIGGFLEIPWTFLKGDTKKVIAALELLATLIGVRLWVPDGKTKHTTRVVYDFQIPVDLDTDGARGGANLQTV